jgi:hypothetical protein
MTFDLCIPYIEDSEKEWLLRSRQSCQFSATTLHDASVDLFIRAARWTAFIFIHPGEVSCE